jgi:hypothetical protein
MIYSSSPTRKHDAILKMIEMNLKEETGLGVFQNVNNARGVSNANVSPQERNRGTTGIVSPGEQAAPTSYMSPRKSMAGRRAASSTTLGAGSKGRHALFRRQFSLRGWRENDSRHDGTREDISGAKWTHLHDYTESPKPNWCL